VTTQITQPTTTTPTSRAAVSVAVVVPAYNEEDNLPNLFGELEAATAGAIHRYRVILVDDGSADRTAEIAAAYRGPVALDLVRQGRNTGLGAAIMAGFRRALEDESVDVIVTIEADTTCDLGQLDRMVGEVLDGADVAQGSMHHPEGEMVDVSGFRQLTSKAASLVMRLATGSSMHTFTNLYRGISAPFLRREFARHGDRLITEPGFAGVTELLVKFMADGARIVEVPIRLNAHKRIGESKMKVWPTVRAQGRVALRAMIGRLRRR
jgi:dolichol-phosphate mannosyltransferase